MLANVHNGVIWKVRQAILKVEVINHGIKK